tara:strand:- start:549 stop:650 length:102 start_codon:yes stop_codon:yes gene_type:complete
LAGKIRNKYFSKRAEEMLQGIMEKLNALKGGKY